MVGGGRLSQFLSSAIESAQIGNRGLTFIVALDDGHRQKSQSASESLVSTGRASEHRSSRAGALRYHVPASSPRGASASLYLTLALTVTLTLAPSALTLRETWEAWTRKHVGTLISQPQRSQASLSGFSNVFASAVFLFRLSAVEFP